MSYSLYSYHDSVDHNDSTLEQQFNGTLLDLQSANFYAVDQIRSRGRRYKRTATSKPIGFASKKCLSGAAQSVGIAIVEQHVPRTRTHAHTHTDHTQWHRQCSARPSDQKRPRHDISSRNDTELLLHCETIVMNTKNNWQQRAGERSG